MKFQVDIGLSRFSECHMSMRTFCFCRETGNLSVHSQKAKCVCVNVLRVNYFLSNPVQTKILITFGSDRMLEVFNSSKKFIW